jgi:protein SCO1/2
VGCTRRVLLVLLLGCGLLWACEPEPELPRLAELPAFSLVDQRGEPFDSKALSGRVWIANFIFTSCPDICPLLTDQLRGVREELTGKGAAVHYVSFSVDPKNDTPEVLMAYSRGRGASHPDWHFLTGSLEDVKATVKGGFKQAMDPMPDEPTNIMHGSHFVLVDGGGYVRGYYRTQGEGLESLVRDAARLAQSSGAKQGG